MSNSGKFVWHELLTSDAKAAEGFYSHVVGWGMLDAGMPDMKYTMLTVNEMAIGGLMDAPDGCATGVEHVWSGYIAVDDVDAKAAEVTAGGGKVHVEPQDIPGVGRFAIVADPQGAAFQLFKPLEPADRKNPEPPTPGTIGWNELQSSDWESAFPFYAKLFGWTKGDALDMGPMGIYQIVNREDQMFGAVMNRADPSYTIGWRYYICVDDITAAADRVKDKGGQVLFGPEEVPGGQWILHSKDPQGVFFALVGPKA